MQGQDMSALDRKCPFKKLASGFRNRGMPWSEKYRYPIVWNMSVAFCYWMEKRRVLFPLVEVIV
jgi:hypothetical protein